MTRNRMLKLVAGDRLIWKLDRTRTFHVVGAVEQYKNGVVRVRIEDNEGRRSAVSTSPRYDLPIAVAELEIDRDVVLEKAQHMVDYHQTDAADVVYDWNGSDWCCAACGMVIDGEGNGTQKGRLS